MLTPTHALITLCVGMFAFVAGLTWWLGPIALAACGLALVAAALLMPDRSEPVPEQIAEAVRKALEQS